MKFLMWLRAKLYELGWLKSYQSKLPVVCVGNVSLGGNGKTPLVYHLAQHFVSQGKRPVVLSRGYGGSLTGPHHVLKTDSAELAGDEPMLITSLGFEVVIARDRATGAQFIEGNDLGDVIILDDGYQHLRLKRDLNILCFDVSSEKAIKRVVSGRVIPFGYLREGLQTALKRADMVIFNARSKTAADAGMLESLIPTELPIYRTRLKAKKTPEQKQKVVLCSGIANPEGFFQSAVAANYEIEEKKFFPDHHKFTQADIADILNQFPECKLLCTSKDFVKIRSLDLDFERIEVFEVELEFEEEPDWKGLLK